jgi:hypothetical protein
MLELAKPVGTDTTGRRYNRLNGLVIDHPPRERNPFAVDLKILVVLLMCTLGNARVGQIRTEFIERIGPNV